MALDVEVSELIGGAPVAVAGESTLPPLLASKNNPLWWGARTSRAATGPDGNDIRFQQCLDWCRDNNQVAYIPPGNWNVDKLVCYTGMKCDGELLTTNAGQQYPAISIESLPSDRITIAYFDGSSQQPPGIPSWVNAAGFLGAAGKNKEAAFSPYYGYTISFLTGSQKFVDRLGGGSLAFRDVYVVHDPDGSFYPAVAIPKSVTWAGLTALAYRNRQPVTVRDLRVRAETGAGGRSGLIRCSRPNVTFDGGAAVNESGNVMNNLFAITGASGVLLEGVHVRGAGEDSLEYGFAIDRGIDITLLACTELFCRRGMDAHGGKEIKIVGGSYPDGVGGHWIEGLYVGGRAYLSSDLPNTAPVHVAGRDVTIENCKVLVRNDQAAVVNVRQDEFELRGAARVIGNDIEFDCTASTGSRRTIFNANTNSDTHDWGRKIYLPDLIEIEGNRIQQRGTSFTGGLSFVSILESNFNPPVAGGKGLSAGGTLKISGNEVDAEVALTPSIVISKRDSYVEGGYGIAVEDQAAAQIYLHCSSTHGSLSTPRHDVDVRNVGTLTWNANYGAFRSASLGARTLSNAIGTGRPGGGYATALGDENEARTSAPLVTRTPWDPPSVASGASTSTTVTVSGAAIGDAAEALLSVPGSGLPSGVVVTADVTAANTVTVTLFNLSGSARDVSPATLRVSVRKA